MRKWLLCALLFSLMVFPPSVGAQGEIKLKSININLWAEYDQPSMLVIHEFTVDENTQLPAKVKLRLPKDGNLIAVAYLENNQLVNSDFSGPEQQGDWQTVTLNVQSYAPHRIEYYEPLIRSGNQRSFVFRWFGDYAVSSYNIAVQLPADSSNVSSQPVFTSTSASTDGAYFIGMLTLSGMKMGQSNEFSIQYERQSETVSKPGNDSNLKPSEPIGPGTEGRVSIDRLPWIIGGFGLLLIGLAMFFYFRSTQTSEQKSHRRRRRAAASPEEAGEEQAYCHECGTRAQPSDRFCRTCGSKLRV